MATLYGTESIQGNIRKGLVFLATHPGDGETRLPFMNRSFISFSFGERDGKRVYIEDFDLIATFDSDRMSRLGYATFEDNTTTYSNLDGLYYWGTHSRPNELSLNLSTDGIDLKKLDDFLYWFRAGETKELILAEHPNRAILARVAEPPQLNLLPFEGSVTITISNLSYLTSTTLYKGDISLRFVMDEPYWYALENILGTKIEAQNENEVDTYVDTWKDANDNLVDIFASKDALKILYEDGIPLGSMFDENMLLGNGAYARVKNDYITWTWDELDISLPSGVSNWASVNWGNRRMYARTCAANGDILGRIAGAIVDASGNGIQDLSNGLAGAGYFYYSGNAPAYTSIKFTFTPYLNGNGYITRPLNAITHPSGLLYNTITIESIHKLELRFTTPNYLTSYNKAVQILSKGGSGSSYSPEDIRATIRDNVHHIYARSYAIKVVDDATNNGSWTKSNSGLIADMKKFLVEDNESLPRPLTVIFNSLTGEAKGKIRYRILSNGIWTFASTDIEENVGDMLRSNHIVIKDRNYPTDLGRITKWVQAHKEYSHRIYHDMDSAPISNFSILYKNMYL